MNTASVQSADMDRLQEAGDWVQQLNEPHDQEVIDRWTAWCAADPSNMHAFERVQDVWEGFAGAAPMLSRPAHAAGRPRRWMSVSVAAGALLLVGMGAWCLGGYSSAQDYRTSPGEQRSETLADGSRLDLAPDSEVRVRYALLRREVQLQRGQAFFAVSHSRVRPFVVRAEDLTVTAAGTAFDVRTDAGGSVVTVSEGSVHVTPTSGTAAMPPRAVVAAAGQRVTFSLASRELRTATVDPVAAESWRRGVLPFVGEPLEDVVGAINRYSARKIDIAPGFARTRFTGTVSLGHVEDWLNALPQIFSVEVIDGDSNAIHIQSRAVHDVG